MEKSTTISCTHLPILNLLQKAYYLSQTEVILLIAVFQNEGFEIHLKWQNLETSECLCMDTLLLRELLMAIKQLVKPNIDFPCVERKRQIAIKQLYDLTNQFRIYTKDTRIAVSAKSVYELLNIESELLKNINDIEMDYLYKRYVLNQDSAANYYSTLSNNAPSNEDTNNKNNKCTIV